MDIRHYRSFIALAEEGSFTSAARKLHIVQSGLSVTIREMEEELGVKLVQRTTRRMSLTDAGELFLDYARPAVTMLKDGAEAVRSQSGIVRGRISLGILMSLHPYIDLPTVLGGFNAMYPNVDFAVRSVESSRGPELVRAGSIDLCFHIISSRKVPTGVEVTPFVQDSLVAVCAITHPLAQRKSVTIAALTEFPFVDLSPERTLRVLIDRSLEAHHLSRKSVFEVDTVETMLQFVAGDLGVAIIPAALAKAWVAAPKLHILPFRAQHFHMPRFKLVILARSRHQKLAGRTVHDLMLETLVDSKKYPNKGTSDNGY